MAKFNIEGLVADILKENEKTRSDDYLLFREICIRKCPESLALPLGVALKKHKDFGLPSYETVLRCRRKVQERNPDLKNPKVAAIRAEEEEAYKNYAKS